MPGIKGTIQGWISVNPNKQVKLHRILKDIPTGTTFTTRDLSNMSKGSKSLTEREIANLLPGCGEAVNVTNRKWGMNTWMKL